MASVTWYFYCDTCKTRATPIRSKLSALCYTCQLLLCNGCKRFHFKCMGHDNINLIDLTHFLTDHSFYKTFSSLQSTSNKFDESELTSLYLDTVRHIKDIDSDQKTQLRELTRIESYQQLDPRRLRTRKCFDFSIKMEEDMFEVRVTGVLCISNTLVVVDTDNRMLKLFDQKGVYLSSTETRESVWGITRVFDRTFATSCLNSNRIYLWTVSGTTACQEKVLFHSENFSNGIHFNGVFYCVLHSKLNAVSVLDEEGIVIRMILVKEICKMKFELGLGIHMDSQTNNIYLPCYSEDGILCMTIEGQPLWFTRFYSAPQGIIDMQGTLCVADWRNGTMHLISKNGQYVHKLLDTEYGLIYMCLGMDDKLFVCYCLMSNRGHTISALQLDYYKDGEDEEEDNEKDLNMQETKGYEDGSVVKENVWVLYEKKVDTIENNQVRELQDDQEEEEYKEIEKEEKEKAENKEKDDDDREVQGLEDEYEEGEGNEGDKEEGEKDKSHEKDNGDRKVQGLENKQEEEGGNEGQEKQKEEKEENNEKEGDDLEVQELEDCQEEEGKEDGEKKEEEKEENKEKVDDDGEVHELEDDQEEEGKDEGEKKEEEKDENKENDNDKREVQELEDGKKEGEGKEEGEKEEEEADENKDDDYGDVQELEEEPEEQKEKGQKEVEGKDGNEKKEREREEKGEGEDKFKDGAETEEVEKKYLKEIEEDIYIEKEEEGEKKEEDTEEEEEEKMEEKEYEPEKEMEEEMEEEVEEKEEREKLVKEEVGEGKVFHVTCLFQLLGLGMVVFIIFKFFPEMGVFLSCL